MNITFLGAAGTVTGSKHLVEGDHGTVLVDCGMFQGLKELRLKNWQRPKFDVNAIDAVVLTHGHLDHTGYLPRLVKHGYRGKIYGTIPTLEIAEIILRDSAKIQEEDAERANREGYSKHRPALPLYSLDDVAATVELFQAVPLDDEIEVADGFQARFRYNSHILGATFIELDAEGQRMVFSGDVGRDNDLLLYPPEKPKRADALLIESTYGGRTHPDEESILPAIAEIVNEAVDRDGPLLVSSFAVERTQLLMYILWQLQIQGKIPDIPMVMDSPMAADVLQLLRHSLEWHKLNAAECSEMCSRFTIVSDYQQTLELRKDPHARIVIAGSGMLSGGRILRYLEVHADNPRATLLLAGYQAEGTRGRALLEGARELKMFGHYWPVNLQLRHIEGLSAHADQNELLSWLGDMTAEPKHTYIVHGERDQAETFRKKLREVKGWEADIPEMNQTATLDTP
jgi:metallo-beta-lactamase family protein